MWSTHAKPSPRTHGDVGAPFTFGGDEEREMMWSRGWPLQALLVGVVEQPIYPSLFALSSAGLQSAWKTVWTTLCKRWTTRSLLDCPPRGIPPPLPLPVPGDYHHRAPVCRSIERCTSLGVSMTATRYSVPLATISLYKYFTETGGTSHTNRATGGGGGGMAWQMNRLAQ